MLFAFLIVNAVHLPRPALRATVTSWRHAKEPIASLSFGSEAEHIAFLEENAALPAGFRVGTTGFEFVPKEAPLPSVMNVTIIALDTPTANFAAVFTNNSFCGSPVIVGRSRLATSKALQALVINNKVSNVCPEGDGVADSEAICSAVAETLGLEGGSAAVLPCSTGVIGWGLPVDGMKAAVPTAAASLQCESALSAARAIMTTDRYPKLRSTSVCGGSIVAFAKGAGMIEPNMATMLAYVLTDVAVPREQMQQMLARAVGSSFNCISVDSDQSTSDTCAMLSSSKVPLDDEPQARAEQLLQFEAALSATLASLAADIVRNGEGTQHVIRVEVTRSPTEAVARGVGKAVVNSPLFKAAVAGNDPNVGRLVGAVGSYLGSSATEVSLDDVCIMIGGERIFARRQFALTPELEDRLYEHMKEAMLTVGGESLHYPPHERCVEISIDLAAGSESVTVYGSDLTSEYVVINADYRS